MSENNNDNGFSKGLIYGLVLGVGIAWLFGTKEGKKLKNEILEKGESVITSAKEQVNEAIDEDFQGPGEV